MAGQFFNYLGSQGGGGSTSSGSIMSGSFASGTTIDSARWLQDDFFTAAELISGAKCVAFNQSGQIQIAMASVSGRAPCIGVATQNILSGTQGIVILYGRAYSTQWGLSGNFFSGFSNQPAYLGLSGEVVSISGIPQSGQVQQIIGQIITGSGLMVVPL